MVMESYKCRDCGSTNVSINESTLECMNCSNWERSDGNIVKFGIAEREYRIFTLTGTINEGYETYPVSMMVVGKDESEVSKTFRNRFMWAPGIIDDDTIDLNEDICSVTIQDISEIDMGDIEWDYTIPIMGEHHISGIGNIDEILDTLTGFDNTLPEVRRAYINGMILHYDKGKSNKRHREAIASCIRQGVDPFGY